jgi:hypothetical protein
MHRPSFKTEYEANVEINDDQQDCRSKQSKKLASMDATDMVDSRVAVAGVRRWRQQGKHGSIRTLMDE